MFEGLLQTTCSVKSKYFSSGVQSENCQTTTILEYFWLFKHWTIPNRTPLFLVLKISKAFRIQPAHLFRWPKKYWMVKSRCGSVSWLSLAISNQQPDHHWLYLGYISSKSRNYRNYLLIFRRCLPHFGWWNFQQDLPNLPGFPMDFQWWPPLWWTTRSKRLWCDASLGRQLHQAEALEPPSWGRTREDRGVETWVSRHGQSGFHGFPRNMIT